MINRRIKSAYRIYLPKVEVGSILLKNMLLYSDHYISAKFAGENGQRDSPKIYYLVPADTADFADKRNYIKLNNVFPKYNTML